MSEDKEKEREKYLEQRCSDFTDINEVSRLVYQIRKISKNSKLVEPNVRSYLDQFHHNIIGSMAKRYPLTCAPIKEDEDDG